MLEIGVSDLKIPKGCIHSRVLRTSVLMRGKDDLFKKNPQLKQHLQRCYSCKKELKKIEQFIDWKRDLINLQLISVEKEQDKDKELWKRYKQIFHDFNLGTAEKESFSERFYLFIYTFSGEIFSKQALLFYLLIFTFIMSCFLFSPR